MSYCNSYCNEITIYAYALDTFFKNCIFSHQLKIVIKGSAGYQKIIGRLGLRKVGKNNFKIHLLREEDGKLMGT